MLYMLYMSYMSYRKRVFLHPHIAANGALSGNPGTRQWPNRIEYKVEEEADKVGLAMKGDRHHIPRPPFFVRVDLRPHVPI